jgi:hypothetical protein
MLLREMTERAQTMIRALSSSEFPTRSRGSLEQSQTVFGAHRPKLDKYLSRG